MAESQKHIRISLLILLLAFGCSAPQPHPSGVKREARNIIVPGLPDFPAPGGRSSYTGSLILWDPAVSPAAMARVFRATLAYNDASLALSSYAESVRGTGIATRIAELDAALGNASQQRNGQDLPEGATEDAVSVPARASSWLSSFLANAPPRPGDAAGFALYCEARIIAAWADPELAEERFRTRPSPAAACESYYESRGVFRANAVARAACGETPPWAQRVERPASAAETAPTNFGACFAAAATRAESPFWNARQGIAPPDGEAAAALLLEATANHPDCALAFLTGAGLCGANPLQRLEKAAASGLLELSPQDHITLWEEPDAFRSGRFPALLSGSRAPPDSDGGAAVTGRPAAETLRETLTGLSAFSEPDAPFLRTLRTLESRRFRNGGRGLLPSLQGGFYRNASLADDAWNRALAVLPWRVEEDLQAQAEAALQASGLVQVPPSAATGTGTGESPAVRAQTSASGAALRAERERLRARLDALEAPLRNETQPGSLPRQLQERLAEKIRAAYAPGSALLILPEPDFQWTLSSGPRGSDALQVELRLRAGAETFRACRSHAHPERALPQARCDTAFPGGRSRAFRELSYNAKTGSWELAMDLARPEALGLAPAPRSLASDGSPLVPQMNLLPPSTLLGAHLRIRLSPSRLGGRLPFYSGRATLSAGTSSYAGVASYLFLDGP